MAACWARQTTWHLSSWWRNHTVQLSIGGHWVSACTNSFWVGLHSMTTLPSKSSTTSWNATSSGRLRTTIVLVPRRGKLSVRWPFFSCFCLRGNVTYQVVKSAIMLMSFLGENFLEVLLTLDPAERADGAHLRTLPLFGHLSWTQDILNADAPFLPQPKDHTDTTYFQARNCLQNLRVSQIDF